MTALLMQRYELKPLLSKRFNKQKQYLTERHPNHISICHARSHDNYNTIAVNIKLLFPLHVLALALSEAQCYSSK